MESRPPEIRAIAFLLDLLFGWLFVWSFSWGMGNILGKRIMVTNEAAFYPIFSSRALVLMVFIEAVLRSNLRGAGLMFFIAGFNVGLCIRCVNE